MIKLIEERYPNIKSIIIQKEFFDSETNNKIRESRSEYSPNSRATFKTSCINRECVEGGFDLESEIEKAVKDARESNKIELTCQGWQDKERRFRHRCLEKIIFQINLGFKS